MAKLGFCLYFVSKYCVTASIFKSQKRAFVPTSDKPNSACFFLSKVLWSCAALTMQQLSLDTVHGLHCTAHTAIRDGISSLCTVPSWYWQGERSETHDHIGNKHLAQILTAEAVELQGCTEMSAVRQHTCRRVMGSVKDAAEVAAGAVQRPGDQASNGASLNNIVTLCEKANLR